MGCLPYFKFYPTDWIAGTLGLTLAERGAYITFVAWSWERGALPLDSEARARLLSISAKELETLWPALAPFWKRTAKGYVNKRLESERVKARRKSAMASASANARHSQNDRNADA